MHRNEVIDTSSTGNWKITRVKSGYAMCGPDKQLIHECKMNVRYIQLILQANALETSITCIHNSYLLNFMFFEKIGFRLVENLRNEF